MWAQECGDISVLLNQWRGQVSRTLRRLCKGMRWLCMPDEPDALALLWCRHVGHQEVEDNAEGGAAGWQEHLPGRPPGSEWHRVRYMPCSSKCPQLGRYLRIDHEESCLPVRAMAYMRRLCLFMCKLAGLAHLRLHLVNPSLKICLQPRRSRLKHPRPVRRR